MLLETATQTIVREISADLETPISVYMKLRGHAPSFLLESVEGGERIARYSFIGIKPKAQYIIRDNQIEIIENQVLRFTHHEGDPTFFLQEEMNKFNLPGVVFKPVHFTPKNINKITNKPKYVSEKCSGIFIEIINRNIYEPVKVAMYLLSKIKELYPDDFNWRPRSKSTGHYYIDLLSGTDVIRKMIDDGNEPEKIYSNSSFDVKDFLQKREKYLLYD